MALDEETIDQQRALLAAHRRTLAHLLTQAAEFSAGHLPAHVANGIAEARAKIEQIKAALRKAAERWEWRARAEAWDEAERAQAHESYAVEREKEREARIKLLRAARSLLIQAIQTLDPEQAKWSDVLTGVRMVTQELRTEYDDEPPQRQG
jgi:hypothetical protein